MTVTSLRVMCYDCVDDPELVDPVLNNTRVNPSLMYTNMAEGHVRERALEVEYVSAWVLML